MKNVLIKTFALLLFITCFVAISPGRVFADDACGPGVTCPNGAGVRVQVWHCSKGLYGQCIETLFADTIRTCVYDPPNCSADDNSNFPSGCKGGDYPTCATSTATRYVGCCPASPPPPPPPPPPPSGSDPDGTHDGSDCTNSFGWACDADGYSTPLIIQFYDGPKANGVLIGSAVADITPVDPTDLAAIKARCGNTANHRFNFTTPNSVKNGVAHDIYAYAVNIGGGSDFKLIGTPKPITCIPPSCTVTGPTSVTTADTPQYSVTSQNAPSGSEIWKSTVASMSWVNVRPKGPDGSSSTSFSCPGSYYVVCNAFSPTNQCTGNPWCPCSGWQDCGLNDKLTVNVRLSCPTGFNVSCAPTGNQATISWNALGCAAGYMLRANKDPQADWVGPGDFTVEPVSPSVTVNIAPNTNYVYDVQGKASGEVYPYAGDRCPFSTFNCPVAINPPTCTSITGSTSMLAGGSASYTAVSSGTGALTYAWSAVGGGTFSNTASNPAVWTSPSGSIGSYTLNVTVKDTYGGLAACPSLVVTTIPNIDCVSISGPASLLAGGSGSYSAVTSGPVVSYAWTGTGGTFSLPSANPTFWTSPVGSPGSYTLNVAVKNSGGLTDPCPPLTVTVSANTPPLCTSITGSPSSGILNFGTTPDSATLTANATDASGIKSYSWFSTPVSGTFSSTSTNPTSWTPTLNTAASYLMNVTITNNLLVSATCPAFTISVRPTFVLTVNTKVKPGTSVGTCGGGTVSSLSGASVIVKTVEVTPVMVGSGPSDSSGTISFSGLTRNKSLDICVTYSSPTAGCASYSSDTACPPPGSSLGCIRVAPPASGDLSETFEFTQSTGDGWVTAIDGDVEANTLGNKMACLGFSGELNTGMGFKAYLINFSNDAAINPKAYAFSNGNGSTISTNNILEDTTRGGWAFKLGGNYDYLGKLTFTPPGSWFGSVAGLNGSGTGLYKMTATAFNALTASAAYPYTLSCSGCRAGIVYVEGTGSDQVLFNNSFTTGGAPVLIVTSLPVKIASTVGVSSAAGTFPFPITASPNVNAAIITKNKITVDTSASAEKVIMLQGPFISLSQIDFNRDVGLQNAKTPVETVKYDPIFLCETTKLEKAHPEVKSYTGLGIFSIQWDYSE